jgi:hypothetical protein
MTLVDCRLEDQRCAEFGRRPSRRRVTDGASERGRLHGQHCDCVARRRASGERQRSRRRGRGSPRRRLRGTCAVRRSLFGGRREPAPAPGSKSRSRSSAGAGAQRGRLPETRSPGPQLKRRSPYAAAHTLQPSLSTTAEHGVPNLARTCAARRRFQLLSMKRAGLSTLPFSSLNPELAGRHRNPRRAAARVKVERPERSEDERP